jgi:hypothetical protein
MWKQLGLFELELKPIDAGALLEHGKGIPALDWDTVPAHFFKRYGLADNAGSKLRRSPGPPATGFCRMFGALGPYEGFCLFWGWPAGSRRSRG